MGIMAEDLENTIPREEHSAPIRVCYMACRLRESKLQVVELVRSACFITLAQCFVAFLVAALANSIEYSIFAVRDGAIATVNIRIFPALVLVPNTLQYAIAWLNLAAGGWGSPESRFWCDVKIMYVRGFNTVRTISRMCSTGLLFGFFAIVTIGRFDLLTLAFLCPLAALAEWQAGLVELQNQYDVKLDDKFAADQTLCLETLHYHQEHRARTVKTWAPYILSVTTKVYMTTWLVCTASASGSRWALFGPLTIAIIFYVDMIPFVMTYLYQRNHMTFCELEVFRVVSDCVLPCAICFIVYGM